MSDAVCPDYEASEEHRGLLVALAAMVMLVGLLFRTIRAREESDD